MATKKVVIDKANRLYQMPPDILSFVRLEKKHTLLKKTELINLANLRWPQSSIGEGDAAYLAASTDKILELKTALAEWYETTHGVKLNPRHEVYIGGSISTIMMSLALAFIDAGDIAFVPQLGIPLYRRVVASCEAEAVAYNLSAKTDWRPDFKRISSRLGRVARILFLNTPHNPTGAELSANELSDLVGMASKENITIVNDSAYQAISSRRPVSLMSVKGAKKVGVEIGSFAYQFGLPSVPFGYAVGNREVINGIIQAARLLPVHITEAYAEAGIAALRQFPNEGLRQVRRQIANSAAEASRLMELLGLEKVGGDTVPFLWARIEERRRATSAATVLYRRSRILIAPGTDFGETGEGYLRLSLTAPVEAYRAAYDRVKRKLRLIKLDKLV